MWLALPLGLTHALPPGSGPQTVSPPLALPGLSEAAFFQMHKGVMCFIIKNMYLGFILVPDTELLKPSELLKS